MLAQPMGASAVTLSFLLLTSLPCLLLWGCTAPPGLPSVSLPAVSLQRRGPLGLPAMCLEGRGALCSLGFSQSFQQPALSGTRKRTPEEWPSVPT